MKNLIKKILPTQVIEFYRRNKKSRFEGKEIKNVFSEIHESKYWNEEGSISGTGSDLSQTKTIMGEINKLVVDYNIQSILDIPCGDFNWMEKVNLEKVKYIGADIVDQLIQENKKKYSDRENISFETLDLTSDQLPESDLIFCRDCLVHLSYENVFKALKNAKKSNSKYLMLTSFTDQSKNNDIPTGEWRALNMQKAPFNLPTPILTISENYKDESGKYNDKAMCLWDLRELSFN